MPLFPYRCVYIYKRFRKVCGELAASLLTDRYYSGPGAREANRRQLGDDNWRDQETKSFAIVAAPADHWSHFGNFDNDPINLTD